MDKQGRQADDSLVSAMYKNKLPTVITWAVMILSVCGFFVHLSNSGTYDGTFYNSDSLYLPSLFKDIIQNGGFWKEWSLTPAPYFFPDMLVYFCLNAIMDFRTAIMAYIFLSIIAWFLVFRYSYTATTGSPDKNAQLLMLLSCAIMITLIIARSKYPLFYLFRSACHGGTALMVFFMFALCAYLTRADERLYNYCFYFLALLITAIVTASDFLFSAQFTLAAILALSILVLLRFVRLRRALIIGGCLAVGTSIGVILNRLWVPLNKVHLYSHINISDGLSKYGTWCKSLFENSTFLVTLIALYFAASLVFILYTLVCSPKTGPVLISSSRNSYLKNKERASLLFIILGFAAMVIFNSVICILSGNVENRYFFPSLIGPAFIGLPLVLLNLKAVGKFLRTGVCVIFCAAIIAASIVHCAGPISSERLARMLHFYPNEVAALDKLSKEHGFKVGIGNYWEAKRFSLLSKENLSILAVRGSWDFRPISKENPKVVEILPTYGVNHWINSLGWYRNVDIDFAITSPRFSPKREDIMLRYNKPKNEFAFGKHEILVYPKGVIGDIQLPDKGPFLGKVGYKVRVRAKYLPSRIGFIKGFSRVAEKESGCLTHGPYIHLAAGKYEMTLDIVVSPGPYSQKVGSWDIVIALPRKALIIEKGDIIAVPDSEEQQFTVSKRFTIPPEHDMEKVEIRTFFNGRGKLQVNFLEIKSLK